MMMVLIGREEGRGKRVGGLVMVMGVDERGGRGENFCCHSVVMVIWGMGRRGQEGEVRRISQSFGCGGGDGGKRQGRGEVKEKGLQQPYCGGVGDGELKEEWDGRGGKGVHSCMFLQVVAVGSLRRRREVGPGSE